MYQVSTSIDKKPGLVKIAIVIGIAAAGLFASLIVVVSVGMAKIMPGVPTPKSPMLINEEQSLFRRVYELPEVKQFLRIYPNATIGGQSYGSSGDYEFEYVKPYPFLEDRIAQGVSLLVSINKMPDPDDIQAGLQKQYREYYYYVKLRCGPADLDDPERGRFPDRLRLKSDELCESEINAMNSTQIRLLKHNQ